MTQCAFLLEVVVGELTLTRCHRLPHPPVSPTIRIKVGGGPSLLVPFLAPAFTDPLDRPDAKGGHYIFQRGKSSIFSASSQLLEGGEGGRVRVEVLAWGGGKGGVPGVLGRCDAVMTSHDLTSTRLGLRGKLVLIGEGGDAVGNVTLTLSLRNLGEVVPAVGNWGSGEGRGRSTTSPGHPRTYEESFDILQDASDPSPHTVPYHDLPNSEKIALKIASLQDPCEAFLGEWQPSHQLGEDGGGMAQPLPILYAGQDREGARIWEEKVVRMGVGEAPQTLDDQQPYRNEDEVSDMGENSYTSDDSNTHTPDTQQQHRGKDSTHNTQYGSQGSSNTPDNTSNTQHHKHKRKNKNTHKHTLKRPYHPPSIARPQGWLRSTPPAAISSAPPPRLNRSHLLRLAAVDHQLGKDLRAEVDRRVRERMKGLEADFLEQVEKLTARRRSQGVRERGRGHTTTTGNHRESVGCQTEGATSSPVPSREQSPSSSSSSLSSAHTSHKQASSTTTTTSHKRTNKATHTHTNTNRSASLATPKERRKSRKPDLPKRTETNITASTSSPTETTEAEKPSQAREADTQLLGTPQRATSDLRVPSAARVMLGEMPKNVTYVIGSDGERVYGDGIVLAPEEEGEGRGGGGGGRHEDGSIGRVEKTTAKNCEKGEGRREDSLVEGRERTGGEGRKKQEIKTGERLEDRPGERGERTGGERRERDTKTNTNGRKNSTSSSHSSAKLRTPKSLHGQTLGSDLRAQWAEQDHQLPREPSQDTWGLTYTIRAAEHDHSTASEHQSTPSTHLTTPQTGSDGGGDGGESYTTAAEEVEEEDFEESVADEEVEEEDFEESGAEEEVEEEVVSASSRSAQVCQEIFRGRKADILSGLATSSPPPSIGESLLSPSRSADESEQSHRGQRNLSPVLNLSPSPRPSTSKHKTTPKLAKSDVLNSNPLRNLSPSPRPSTSKHKATPKLAKSDILNSNPLRNLSPSPRPSTAKHKTTPTQTRSNLSPSPRTPAYNQRTTPKPQPKSHLRKQYKENIYTQDSDHEGERPSTSAYAQLSGSSRGARESARGSVGSSISDISARIAALLVAKRMSVPRMNTESVSSYVPSEEHPGTLSSVSDVLMSPSTSFSE
ncbi:serine-rich adhesin for platelets-like isoform X2 [Eriocheir sinensis]|uniref:serine-rich adhesin for platelets-like isoform X2 n=1 Tax=Eriocheir sinensis TaxID=95602 RepID=UPI0021CA28B3|nr:serine-rich adhesin for platelets-like isoform X2 [Eriocheir sinensis]